MGSFGAAIGLLKYLKVRCEHLQRHSLLPSVFSTDRSLSYGMINPINSTHVELRSPDTMRIDGELTLRGVSRPVVLDATFNGGYAGHPMDPHARIGFSARGLLRRSEFGMSVGIPAAGTTMGVGDEVDIVIETEFNGLPLPKTAARLSSTNL